MASPWTNSIRPATYLMFVIRLEIVCGYQRERMPFPFSPFFRTPAPSARIPPCAVRFFKTVWNANSRWLLGVFANSALADSTVSSKETMRFASHSASPPRIVFQTAAICSSSSTMTTRPASCSKAAVKLMIPPPANGSTKTAG